MKAVVARDAGDVAEAEASQPSVPNARQPWQQQQQQQQQVRHRQGLRAREEIKMFDGEGKIITILIAPFLVQYPNQMNHHEFFLE